MNVNKVRIIAWHEYIVNVRRIGFIFITLLFPALGMIGLVIAGFFSGQATSFLRTQFAREARKIGIVDQSGLFTPIAPQFAEDFIAFSDEDAAKRALLADQVGAFVVISSDYFDR